MIFGRTPLDQAVGAILAHSVSAGGTRYKKGRRLSAEDVAALAEAGVTEVVAARLEGGDVGEDEAAKALAEAATGRNLAINAPFTGRCNLVAGAGGLLVYDPARLDALNLVDEGITIAALAPYEPVEPRQMVATIKMIPFAVDADALRRTLDLAATPEPLLRIAPFQAKAAALIQTELPGLKASVLDKTAEVTAARMEQLGGRLAAERRCAHDSAALTETIHGALAPDVDLILIAGASAITDRRDVIPDAIERAGGQVEHFGMPVDPGNLMLLGSIERDTSHVPVLGLPGCARSPKLNGFDWVLQRLVAGIGVSSADIKRMGAGGLLKDIQTRPLPRGEATPERARTRADAQYAPRIAAIVLAAGLSRRMGAQNKLLAQVGDRPMVRHVVDAALASRADPAIVVTGHEADAVRTALDGIAVQFAHNPNYAEGLSTSLACGLRQVPEACDGAVVLLADMPGIAAAHIDRLIAAFNPVEGRAVCVATHQGKRGHPVLWARGYFPEITAITGDRGAKALLTEHEEAVEDVEIGSDAVLVDVDTPDALEQARSAAGPHAAE